MSGLSEPHPEWDQYVNTSDRVAQLLHSLEARQSTLQDLQHRTALITTEIERLDAAYTAAKSVFDDIAVISILELLTATYSQRLALMRLEREIVGSPLGQPTTLRPATTPDETNASPIRLSSDENINSATKMGFTGLTLETGVEAAVTATVTVTEAVVDGNLLADEPVNALIELTPPPPVAPTLDEEGETVLRAQVIEVQQLWSALSQQINTDYNIQPATLLRVRSLVCKIRSIQEAYSVYQPEPPCMGDLLEVLTDIAFCCLNNTSDCLIRVKLDLDALEEDETPQDFWRELSKNYLLVAEAQEAMNWCKEHQDYPLELLNTIAARQQMLHVLLQQLDFKDENQCKLFADIRNHQGNGFLSGLNSALAYNDLASIAGKLPSELRSAQRSLEDRAASKQKALLRDEAIEQLRLLFEGRSDFGTNTARFAEDKAALNEALDACVKAGIPPSCKDVTALIGPCAEQLLRGTARFKNHMKFAVEHLKKVKRDEEAEELDKEEDIAATDAQMREWISSLKPLMQGKVFTIACGGKPQDVIVSALKANLPFADVTWLYGEQLNSSRKIQSTVKKSDIFLVVIKFISHDVSESGKKWIQAKGGDFIALRAGFGFKSILKALFDTYVVRNAEVKD